MSFYDALAGLVTCFAAGIGGSAPNWTKATVGGAVSGIAAGILIGLLLAGALYFEALPLGFFIGAAIGLILGVLAGPLGFALKRGVGPRYLAAVSLTCALTCVAVMAHSILTPVAEQVVPWPDEGVKVRVQARFHYGADYSLQVETVAGTLSLPLWTNSVSADRVNIYRTPRGSVAITGGGDQGLVVEVTPRRVPRLGGRGETVDASAWTYIGAVVGMNVKGLTFFSPERLRECIPLYGEGRGPPGREEFYTPNNC